MPQIHLNGVDIFYEIKGEGEEVVAFLNGVAMSTDSWILQTPYFAKEHRVLLHDFRGQGKSSLVPTQYTFEQHAKDLKVLLDHLGLEKIHIVGVSYGAEVGMYFALLFPERLKTLTLGTAVSESEPLLQAMIESWILAAQSQDGYLFFKVMAPLVYSNQFYRTQKRWLDHRAEIFQKVATKEWYDAFIGLCRNFLTLNVTAHLHEIQAPTLIVAGGDDLLKPVYYSEIIHAQIPHSELVVIEDAGHGLFLEKPNEFNEIISDFIQAESRRRGEGIFF